MSPKVTIGSAGNLWARLMHFENKGDIEEGHTHQFDHLTLLSTGKLEVTVDDRTSVFVAPHLIFIKKGKLHELVAIEDDTVAVCLHALSPDIELGDVLEPSMVP
jgi:quercetin dioxygenase-like cupin family protein